MTRKQQLFCDYYIENPNATQAAIKAGYSKKTARDIGCENLKKPDIKAYIDKAMEQKKKDSIACQDEILSYFTNVMRGNIIGESRNKAAELLGKRYRLWDGEQEQHILNTGIITDERIKNAFNLLYPKIEEKKEDKTNDISGNDRQENLKTIEKPILPIEEETKEQKKRELLKKVEW